MIQVLKDKECYIFDMDGTLIDLEKLNHNSYSNTINEFFGKEVTNDDYQKYFSGTRTAKAFEDFLKSKGIGEHNTDELINHFREMKEDNLVNNFHNCVTLIKGAKEYLEYLKSENKIVILATSTIKDFVDIITEKLDISQYFNYIITAEDVVKGKPDPEIYLLSVKKANVDKSDAVIFEDSKNGIDSAIASGVMCVGIHTKGLNDNYVNKADLVIENYEEIL